MILADVQISKYPQEKITMTSDPILSDKKLVHVSRMPIRWGDMDAMGHVNNVTYFRYLEQARIEWYSSIGREHAGSETVVVSCYCHYYAPVVYLGNLEIKTYAGSPGRSSFEIVQEIRRTDAPDVLCALGGSKVVWIDIETGKSMPVPSEVRQLMTP